MDTVVDHGCGRADNRHGNRRTLRGQEEKGIGGPIRLTTGPKCDTLITGRIEGLFHVFREEAFMA